jgi:starch synthase
MKVAFVSSEIFPYAKTGGLADVAGSLPKALEKLGCEIKLFMPKYNIIDDSIFGLHYNWQVGEIPIRVNGKIRAIHLHQAKLPQSNIEVNFIDNTNYYSRGKIYTNDPDEDERFILFCKGVIESLQRLGWVPDVIHCNDWQTGLLPLFVKDNYNWDKLFDNTAFLFTIHNIGYQGRFSKDTLFKAEIREDLFYPDGPVEVENSVNFMKTGIVFSDIINTVSPTYAKEIMTPGNGEGLHNILLDRKDDVYGILNGVDYSDWSPDDDSLIPFRYTSSYLTGKLKNKKFLIDHLRLPFDEKIPLAGIISRMVSQKGFDIFSDAIDFLMKLDIQLVVLGSGEDRFENLFRGLQNNFPNKVSTYIGYSNDLSHLIEAGADMFLMPSFYEPCGLNQIYSLKYGTVPIVRKTGGLADTVLDWDEIKTNGKNNGNGFSFNNYSGQELLGSIQRALNYFSRKEIWTRIQKNGMKMDFSWEKSAKEYIELYKKAIEKRKYKKT